MADSIKQWLESLDLEKYVELFRENDIDFAALPHITEEDLKELGVTLGARRKILAAIGSSETAVPASPVLTSKPEPSLLAASDAALAPEVGGK